MSLCDLKTQNEAWNDGMKAFKESYMLTGDPSKSIRYALSEIQKKHPNLSFDQDSFVTPVVDLLRTNGFVDSKYSFSKKAEAKKKKNEDRIGELAKTISEKEFKEKTTPKQKEELTDEEKKIKSFVSSKYGKSLSKAEINELLDQEIDGNSVYDMLTEQIEEQEEIKEIEKERKKAIKQQESALKKEERDRQKEIEKFEKKIAKTVEKFSKLSTAQKAEMARKMAIEFKENGMLDRSEIINIYAEVTGLPHVSDKFAKVLEQVSKDKADYEALLDERDRFEEEYAEEKKNYPNGVPKDIQAQYRQRHQNLVNRMFNANVKMAKSTTKASSYLRENSWFIHDLADMMTMNIMGIESLERNLDSGVFDTVLRQPANALSAIYSKIASGIFKTDNPIPFGGRIAAGRFIPQTLRKVKAAFTTGKTEFTPDIGRFDYLNAFNEFEKAKNTKGKESIIAAIKGTLKLPPMAISRILNSTDAMFFDPVMMGELGSIAKANGLKGLDAEMFMFNPDPASYEIAKKRAEDVTYKNKSAFLNALNNLIKFDSRKAADKQIFEKGWSPMLANTIFGAGKMATNVVFPFISTPANIFARTIEYALPEISVIRAVGQVSNSKLTKTEKVKAFSDHMGKATVGYFIRHIAFQLLAAGVISAGYDDEEKDVSDAIEKKAGGPNRINRDALIRALFMMDATEKEGDSYVNLNSLGLMGTTLGTYAHAFNGLTKEEIQKLQESSVLFAPKEAKTIGFSSITSTLDNTFLSGVNQLMKVLREPDNKNIDRYTIASLNMIISSVYPATLQKISESKESERKRIFDGEKSWTENFYKSAGYHFLYDSGDLKNKYFSLSEKENGVVKKRDYMLWDNWLGRAISATTSPFDSKEVNKDDVLSKILDRSKELKKEDRSKLFPDLVDRKINFTETGRRRKRDKVYEVELNDDQYDYLQKTASFMRALQVSTFVNSEDFKTANIKSVIETLSTGYKKSREDAIAATVKKYPELMDYENIKTKESRDETKKLIKEYIND